MYYTYVLLCDDGKQYIGYTSNIEERFNRHKKGLVFSTKGRLPVKLIFYEAFLHQQDAIRREQYFKTSAGKRALRLMMREYFKDLVNSSLV
ncbi:MAG: hypothetical protein UX72_C0008G0035 [Parcubacteria group bacterium GW2011_GWA2_47_10]|nr:MAG: hypothetical protein UX72_C0008G0035 [Parcubacteria group bacterium GW2011_GWA2_47_10]